MNIYQCPSGRAAEPDGGDDGEGAQEAAEAAAGGRRRGQEKEEQQQEGQRQQQHQQRHRSAQRKFLAEVSKIISEVTEKLKRQKIPNRMRRKAVDLTQVRTFW